MDVGKRIKYFRQERGITVNKLANLAGVSQSYLRDIELGNKQPTVEYLSYICEALGVTMSAFFDDNIEGIEQVLRIIMEKPNIKVLSVIPQAFAANLANHSIYFDVFAKDAHGKLLDIEVQRASSGASPLEHYEQHNQTNFRGFKYLKCR